MGKAALALIMILTTGSVAGFGLARFTIDGANPMWDSPPRRTLALYAMTDAEHQEVIAAVSPADVEADRGDDRR